jgi:hypothetical protein
LPTKRSSLRRVLIVVEGREAEHLRLEVEERRDDDGGIRHVLRGRPHALCRNHDALHAGRPKQSTKAEAKF